MAFIKNQILKRLSGFTKNFSPDKLKLSVLKGETQLANLELNEEMLMGTLGLPTWLRINKATCNWISIKISWTRLKTQPVVIHLDRVEVEMEMCDEPRDANQVNAVNIPARAANAEYGLVDRIVDGITLEVNTVAISFRSRAFAASIELSRLCCASCAPNWASVSDLKLTQIRNPVTGEILVFKEVAWETTRFEARAVFDAHGGASSGAASLPLRLIANSARIRVAMKKRCGDNSIVATRMQVLLNDLLWVLTLSQLEAAIVFVRHLLHAVSMSREQERRLHRDEPPTQAASSRAPATSAKVNVQTSQLFDRFDISETSYHFYVKYVDLHLCEDGQPNRKLSSNAVEGGGVRITLEKLAYDMYPLHKPDGSRKNWLGMNSDLEKRMHWQDKLLEQYWNSMRQTNELRSRADASSIIRVHKEALREMCCLVRLKRIQFRTVSTPTASSSPGNCDKPTLDLIVTDTSMPFPEEIFSIYLEYGDHFYLSTPANARQLSLPVPPPNVYLIVYPIRLAVDQPTLVWLNAFGTRLSTHLADLSKRIAALDQKPQTDAVIEQQANVRLEVLYTCVILPVAKGNDQQVQALQLGVSSVLFTNACDSEVDRVRALRDTRDDLLHNLPDAQQSDLFAESSVKRLADAGNFWFVQIDRLWIEHLLSLSVNLRPQAFLNEFTFRACLLADEANGRVGLAVDLKGSKFVHLEISSRQLQLLESTVDSMSKLSATLLADREEIIECAKRNAVDLEEREAIPSLGKPPQVFLLLSPQCVFVVTCVLNKVNVTNSSNVLQAAKVPDKEQHQSLPQPRSSSPSIRSAITDLSKSQTSPRREKRAVNVNVSQESKHSNEQLKHVSSSGNLSLDTDDDGDTTSVSYSEFEDLTDQSELLEFASESAPLFDESNSEATCNVRTDEPQQLFNMMPSSDLISMCSDADSALTVVSLFVGSPRVALCLATDPTMPCVNGVVQCESVTVRELVEDCSVQNVRSEHGKVARLVETTIAQLLTEKHSPFGSVRALLRINEHERLVEADVRNLRLSLRGACIDALRDLLLLDLASPAEISGIQIRIRVNDLSLCIVEEAQCCSASAQVSSGFAAMPVNVDISSLTVEIGANGAIRVRSPSEPCNVTLDQTVVNELDHLDDTANRNDHNSDSEQILQMQLQNSELTAQVSSLTDANERMARESEQLILLVNELQDELQSVHKRLGSVPPVSAPR